MIRHHLFLFVLSIVFLSAVANESVDIASEEPHPDPNEEDYAGMAYIGRLDDEGRRVGFDQDNGEPYSGIRLSLVVLETIHFHFTDMITTRRVLPCRNQIHIWHIFRWNA